MTFPREQRKERREQRTENREKGTENSEQRKMPLILALLLLSSAVFAQETVQEIRNEEGGIRNEDALSIPTVTVTPLHHYDALHHLEAGVAVPVFLSFGRGTAAPGASLGYYCDSVFAPGVGFGAWAGLVFPLLGQGVVGQLFHLTTGPVVTVWKNERFSVPVGGGLYINAGFLNGMQALCAGVGVHAAFEWRFSSRGYVYARVQGAYTFTGGGEFVIHPGIGVGISERKEKREKR